MKLSKGLEGVPPAERISSCWWYELGDVCVIRGEIKAAVRLLAALAARGSHCEGLPTTEGAATVILCCLLEDLALGLVLAGALPKS